VGVHKQKRLNTTDLLLYFVFSTLVYFCILAYASSIVDPSPCLFSCILDQSVYVDIMNVQRA
jgi:hypothetical protein